MYANEFNSFMDLKSVENNVPQSEENPAEEIFIEIFGKGYSQFKKGQTFKKW
jgi:hypothetical protein